MESLKTKYANVLVKPRITEKGTFLNEQNVYAFEIDKKAGKKEVTAALKAFYGITPLKVRIVRNPSKSFYFRNKPGVKSGIKKAYVYLKKGEKLEL